MFNLDIQVKSTLRLELEIVSIIYAILRTLENSITFDGRMAWASHGHYIVLGNMLNVRLSLAFTNVGGKCVLCSTVFELRTSK